MNHRAGLPDVPPRAALSSRAAPLRLAPALRAAPILLLAAVLAGCAFSDERTSPTGPALLDGESVDVWVERWTPDETTAAWRSIPWRPSIHEGAIDAASARRPLLLWLMNGHPLGCT